MPKTNPSAIIESIGVANGRNVVSNDELAQMMDTSDDWIFSRTGIKKRCIADPDETNCSMGVDAAVDAIERMDSPERIRAIYFATNTNMSYVPAGAFAVHAELCRRYPNLVDDRTLAFDIVGGCQGINYALHTASSVVQSGNVGKDHVLVIGADTLTKVSDFRTEGREVAVLTADVASAFLLGPSDEPSVGYVGYSSKTLGDKRGLIRFENNRERVDFFEARQAVSEGRAPFTTRGSVMEMDGKGIFKLVTPYLEGIIRGFGENPDLNPLGFSLGEVSFFPGHQANARMFYNVGKGLSDILPDFYQRCVITIKSRGNGSTGSQGEPCRYALWKMEPYQKFVQSGFGAGVGCISQLYIADSKVGERRHRFRIDDLSVFDKPDFSRQAA